MLGDGEYFSTDDLSALAPVDPGWQLILHASNQVVLYNPTSHALSIRRRSSASTPVQVIKRARDGSRCPYCHRSIPSQDGLRGQDEEELDHALYEDDLDEHPRSRAPNYFQLLQIANETASIPSTPIAETSSRDDTPPATPTTAGSTPFRAGNMADGYFKAFFQEECRLGMGANGSVYLCQHLLDGNPLGHFAVKKIAVGQSHSYLLNILSEVRLLEKLHHPNIITYHHAWLETCQFSSFGPKVPTLHVLMQWAEGGSLDDFIDVRQGRAHQFPQARADPSTPTSGTNQAEENTAPYSRGARIRAFRALQHAPPEERERLRKEMERRELRPNSRDHQDWKAVHLLSAEEIKSLFKDVVEGLAFLHDKSILHLDLKPGNVLLTWDEGKLIPRAMLSDFGTSQDMLNSRARSGNTGTLEYASPESLPSPTGLLFNVDSKSDMWSLGMILHKLLFFSLPYRYASDNLKSNADSRRDGKEISDLLEKEVLEYPGFKSTQALAKTFDSRHLPRALLVLLEGLLNVTPSARPASERVLSAIREGRLDPVVKPSTNRLAKEGSLVPVRRHSQEGAAESSSASLTAEPQQYKPSELPLWIDGNAKENQPPAPERREEEPSLGVAAILYDTPQPVPWATLRLWNRVFVLNPRTARIIATRTVKSGLLIAKVLTLYRMHMDSDLRSAILLWGLGLAIADTWFDGLSTSVVLGLAHLVVVHLAVWTSR